MIIDRLRHAKQFHGRGIGIRAGLQFLARPDLITLEKGRYDLPDSGGSYALMQEHETKLRAHGTLLARVAFGVGGMGLFVNKTWVQQAIERGIVAWAGVS